MSSDDTHYSSSFISPRSVYDGLEVGGVLGDSDLFAEEVEASTLSVLMRAVAPCFLDPRDFLVKGVPARLPEELQKSRLLPLMGLCLMAIADELDGLGLVEEDRLKTLNDATKRMKNCLLYGESLATDVYRIIEDLLAMEDTGEEDIKFLWELPFVLCYLLQSNTFVETVELSGIGRVLVTETLSEGIPTISVLPVRSDLNLFSLDEMMAAGFLRPGLVPPEIEKVFSLPQLKGFVPVSFPVEEGRDLSFDVGNLTRIDHIGLFGYTALAGSRDYSDVVERSSLRFGMYPVFYRGSVEIPLFCVNDE